MAWYNLNSTDHIAKEFSEERYIDRCIFCGDHKDSILFYGACDYSSYLKKLIK